MGASHGSCLHRTPHHHTHPPICKRQLSAAFNMSSALDDTAPPLPRLNLNTATPEQLMTLSGIDRRTAEKIVEHRREIGGFRRVEDVALVTGAHIVTEIRREVCVRHAGQVVGDDVSRSSATSSRSHSSTLDVNAADVFQLTRIPGVTQSLAERIVARRDRRGPFRQLDELTRVRGVRPTVLATARPYLMVGQPCNSSASSPLKQNGCILNGGITTKTTKARTIQKSDDSHPLDGASMLQMYGPLIRRSIRRTQTAASLGDERVRVGVWNLERLDHEKVANPGIKEVVCMTLLENSVGILAIQDLLDTEALQMLCDELNNPTIPNVQRFASASHGRWKCVSSSAAEDTPTQISCTPHLGFVYDVNAGIELRRAFELDACLPPGGTASIGQKPFCAVFKVKKWEVSLVNYPGRDLRNLKDHCNHMANGSCVKAAGSNGTSVELKGFSLYHNQLKDMKNAIVLGELDADEATLKRLEYASVRTDSAATCEDANKTITYWDKSRIWMAPSTEQTFTGESDVIRDGLTSPWIPCGWAWGGPASHHRPLWAEFYTNRMDDDVGNE